MFLLLLNVLDCPMSNKIINENKERFSCKKKKLRSSKYLAASIMRASDF